MRRSAQVSPARTAHRPCGIRSPSMTGAEQYSQVPYDYRCFAQTQPCRLAFWARLHGIPASAPAAGRVLEVGAGPAVNLLPMLGENPSLQAVALDLHPPSVEAAHAAAVAAGVADRLTAAVHDVGDGPGAFGEQDFVIAHGVYSWVPNEARAALLRAYRQWLAPAGVGYLNFNTRPGNSIRADLRTLLLELTAGETHHAAKVKRARAVVRALERGVVGSSGVNTSVREALAWVNKVSDSILAHDLLGPYSEPTSFLEFARAAEAAGLRVLGASFDDDGSQRLPALVGQLSTELGLAPGETGLLHDTLLGTSYREVLVVRDDAPRAPAAFGGWAAARINFETADGKPAPNVDLKDGVRVHFSGLSGVRASADRALLKAALCELGAAWPAAVPLEELASRGAARLGRELLADEPNNLATAMMELHRARAVDLRVDRPNVAVAVSPTPLVPVSSRLQAPRGMIWSLHHAGITLPTAEGRWLVGAMDGTRTLGELVEAANENAAASGASTTAAKLSAELDSLLPKLQAAGVLANPLA